MNLSKRLALGFGLALAAQGAFGAGTDRAHGDRAVVVVAQAAAASAMAEGEVRKVDKSAGKITLRHGPIENLSMPPMTMVFRVSEAGMLDGVAPGDRVRFHAEEIKGAYTVTRIEKQ